jgi:hypothetical protein
MGAIMGHIEKFTICKETDMSVYTIKLHDGRILSGSASQEMKLCEICGSDRPLRDHAHTYVSCGPTVVTFQLFDNGGAKEISNDEALAVWNEQPKDWREERIEYFNLTFGRVSIS